jgi:hypothetical protein
MDDEKQLAVVAMIAYAMADVIGSRLAGQKSSPKEVAERSAAFGKYLTNLAAEEPSDG